MSHLVNDLIYHGYLRSDEVIEAMSNVNREDFLPPNFRKQAEIEMPLPIGHGQTVTPPRTTATMLELLDVKRGHIVLDAGTGSGWTAALLGNIVGATGKVVTIERIEDLFNIAKVNIEKYGYLSDSRVECIKGDATEGYVEGAPYDRILVSATASTIPDALKNQLKIGGKLVIPLHNSICYFEKRSADDFYKEEFSGFNFVPFVRRSGF
ncbi:MAG: protein-L-isoaspartate O-methyltransferase [Candidatus Moranbacteria bacterium]|nr:protein-L-isoaspartate O-methyltransferase [Candidatus Moranbacteria bacterium]